MIWRYADRSQRGAPDARRVIRRSLVRPAFQGVGIIAASFLVAASLFLAATAGVVWKRQVIGRHWDKAESGPVTGIELPGDRFLTGTFWGQPHLRLWDSRMGALLLSERRGNELWIGPRGEYVLTDGQREAPANVNSLYGVNLKNGVRSLLPFRAPEEFNINFGTSGTTIAVADRSRWDKVRKPYSVTIYSLATGKTVGIIRDLMEPEGSTVFTPFVNKDDERLIIVCFRRGFDLRLMSWGNGTGVPTSGNNLIMVGTDNNNLLHVRIYDQDGHRVTDTNETKLPPAQAQAILTLKQRLTGLLPPHALTDAEKEQGLREVTSIVGQTLRGDRVIPMLFDIATGKALAELASAEGPRDVHAFTVDEDRSRVATVEGFPDGRFSVQLRDLRTGALVRGPVSGKSGRPIEESVGHFDVDYVNHGKQLVISLGHDLGRDREIVSIIDSSDLAWNSVATGRELREVSSQSERYIAWEAAPTGTLNIWRIGSDSAAPLNGVKATEKDNLAVNRDGSRLLIWGPNRSTELWDILSGKSLGTLSTQGVQLGSSFTPDGNAVQVSREGGQISLFDARTGTSLAESINEGNIIHLDYDSNCWNLLVWNQDGEVVRYIRGRYVFNQFWPSGRCP